MFKTAVVTIASMMLAYPIVGGAINLGLVLGPFEVMGALFLTGILNAYILVKIVGG